MREASRRSGVSVQTVSLVAAGESDISIGKLNLICTEALDCSLYTFFGPLPSRERAA
jgi:transcriptional regulator with XRE-family HTH domain